MAKKQGIDTEKGELSDSQTKEVQEGRFFSIRQVAEAINYSTKWITTLVQTGRIKGIKPTGHSWRIPESEMERIKREGIPPQPRTSTSPPEEIVVPPEHLERVISKPKEKKEEPKKEAEEELEWPFNLFLTKE